MPLLILDRDGVVNRDSSDYIKSLAEWSPIAGSIEAIAGLSRAGYRIAIATNQSGLSRGLFSLDDMAAIHARLCQLVAEQGGRITGIFYCPHLPGEGCRCRKPATGLLEEIESELGEPAGGAIFIGDNLKDLQAARAFGCQPVLVRTGKGRATEQALRDPTVDLADPESIPVYDDLASAARAILHTQPDKGTAPKHDR
jgi:D-glycero-D-manno-heptose 1,7-bisphosphate phosphatase